MTTDNMALLFSCSGTLKLPYTKTAIGFSAPWDKFPWPPIMKFSRSLTKLLCNSLSLDYTKVCITQTIGFDEKFVFQVIEVFIVSDKAVDQPVIAHIVQNFTIGIAASLGKVKPITIDNAPIHKSTVDAVNDHLVVHGGKPIKSPFQVQSATIDPPLLVAGKYRPKPIPNDTPQHDYVECTAFVDGLSKSKRNVTFIDESGLILVLEFDRETFFSPLVDCLANQKPAVMRYREVVDLKGRPLKKLIKLNDVLLQEGSETPTGSTQKEE